MGKSQALRGKKRTRDPVTPSCHSLVGRRLSQIISRGALGELMVYAWDTRNDAALVHGAAARHTVRRRSVRAA